jgi:CubicO group peptidase (beta-lactamase class C family)
LSVEPIVTKEERIREFLGEQTAAGSPPGAVFASREPGHEIVVARGDAVVVPERIAATEETIFDLASLTKTLATTLLAAIEIEAGRLELDAPVSTVLDEFDRDDKRHITFRELLTHTSGLDRWAPFYVHVDDPDDVLGDIAEMALDYPTGSRVLYSDPNFITLGRALERMGGASLDRLFADRIAAPLGLVSTGFCPDLALRPRIAASEIGNEHERVMTGERGAGYTAWRKAVIWGEVHDGNAHFLGGVAGHAGLFGTAREAAVIAEQFLPGSRLLTDEATFALFRTNFTEGLESHRSIGWMLASSPESSAGDAMPPDAFGHTGFTGTSVWVDPHARRVNVLLTNRTHPTYASPPLNAMRRRLNALAAGRE